MPLAIAAEDLGPRPVMAAAILARVSVLSVRPVMAAAILARVSVLS
jgi:hypothetical protein